MSRSRRALTYTAFAALVVMIVSDTWLHLPFRVTLVLALVLALETCWSLIDSQRVPAE